MNNVINSVKKSWFTMACISSVFMVKNQVKCTQQHHMRKNPGWFQWHCICDQRPGLTLTKVTLIRIKFTRKENNDAWYRRHILTGYEEKNQITNNIRGKIEINMHRFKSTKLLYLCHQFNLTNAIGNRRSILNNTIEFINTLH